MSAASDAVEFLVPLGKAAQTLAQGGGGLEAEVPLQGGHVCVGHGHVAGLHGHQFLVRVEVVILRGLHEAASESAALLG